MYHLYLHFVTFSTLLFRAFLKQLLLHICLGKDRNIFLYVEKPHKVVKDKHSDGELLCFFLRTQN